MSARPRLLHGGHLRHLPVVAICTVAALAAGCAEPGSAERVAADAPMHIEASQAFVTFENRSGLPLTDVSIAIVPYGPGEFTRLLPRVENTAKRQVPLTEFRGRDGTPFNMRVARPKSLRVRAQDATGKSYDLVVPWK
jgi:hypothetical protein